MREYTKGTINLEGLRKHLYEKTPYLVRSWARIGV